MTGPRSRPALVGRHRADVVVVGGSFAGCAAAIELARRRRKVVVLEAGGLLSRASSGALGHLAVGPARPYASLREELGVARALPLWEAGRENVEAARTLLESGGQSGLRRAGAFLCAADRAQALLLAESDDLLREDGLVVEFLDHYMLEARFDVRGVPGALWCGADADAEPRLLARALSRAAEAAGVELYEASEVRALDLAPEGVEAATDRGSVRAAQAVLAAGASLRALVPALAAGLVPVERRTALCALAAGASVPSPLRFLDGRLAARVSAEGLLVSSAGAPAEVVAAQHLAGVAPRAGRQSATTVAVGADGLPLVGPLPGLAAFASCGHGGASESLAFAAARWIALAAAGGPDPTPELLRAARVLDVPAMKEDRKEEVP